MHKEYLIKSYAYLVKVGKWDIMPTEGSTNNVVPEEYREEVSEYLISK